MTDSIFDDLDFDIFAAESDNGEKDSKSIAIHKRRFSPSGEKGGKPYKI